LVAMASDQGPPASLEAGDTAPFLEPTSPHHGETSPPREITPPQDNVSPQGPLPEQEADMDPEDAALHLPVLASGSSIPASSQTAVPVLPRSSTKRVASGTDEEAEATRTGGTS